MAGPEKKTAPTLSKAAPSRGDAKAKVVIQEFADFQCPFCKMAQESMDKLLAAYPGRVRVVWRNMPLTSIHPDAQLAAEAALEVLAQKGTAGFWKMQSLLFANQRVDGGLQRESLDGYAKQLGLDMKKWAAALDGHTHKDEVACRARRRSSSTDTSSTARSPTRASNALSSARSPSTEARGLWYSRERCAPRSSSPPSPARSRSPAPRRPTSARTTSG
jgi:hypothetical protein